MRRWGIPLTVLAFVCAIPGVAVGYWLTSSPAASIRVSAGTVPGGLPPTAAGSGSSVTVTVTPVGPPVENYLLRRYGPDGVVAATLPCTASCLDSGVPDGQWTYTETPLLGNWSGAESAAGAVVVVDTTAPTPAVDPVDATADRTPLLTGSAGRLPGDTGQVNVELLAGTRGLLQRTVPVVAGRWQLTVGPLKPQRSYTVLVRQRDSAGNEGQSRATFVLDTRAPTVSLAPVHWPLFSGKVGTVPASASSSADSAQVEVQILRAGRLVRTLTTTRSGGRWSVSGAGLGSGDYTARAVQRDTAGNVSTSRSRTFSIDATAPTVTVTVPPYVNTAPIVTGRAGTAAGDERAVLVEVSAGGPVVQRLRVRVLAGVWRAVLRPLLPNRHYTLTVTQLDAAGNRGVATAGFVIDIAPPGGDPRLCRRDAVRTGGSSAGHRPGQCR